MRMETRGERCFRGGVAVSVLLRTNTNEGRQPGSDSRRADGSRTPRAPRGCGSSPPSAPAQPAAPQSAGGGGGPARAPQPPNGHGVSNAPARADPSARSSRPRGAGPPGRKRAPGERRPLAPVRGVGAVAQRGPAPPPPRSRRAKWVLGTRGRHRAAPLAAGRVRHRRGPVRSPPRGAGRSF